MASIVGLLLPALDEGSAASVAGGARRRNRLPLVRPRGASTPTTSRGQPARRRRSAPSVLVFAVLLVHSLPEGFAIGTAYASDTERPRPVRDPRDRAPEHPRGHERRDPDGGGGLQPRQQFWAAVLTSAPQPVGAVDRLPRGRAGRRRCLPFSFAFAAGAMLALVVARALPAGSAAGSRQGARGRRRRRGDDARAEAALGV